MKFNLRNEKPRELWIRPLDIPSPGSFKITGAVVTGDNPQDGEVLFREVLKQDHKDGAILIGEEEFRMMALKHINGISLDKNYINQVVVNLEPLIEELFHQSAEGV